VERQVLTFLGDRQPQARETDRHRRSPVRHRLVADATHNRVFGYSPAATWSSPSAATANSKAPPGWLSTGGRQLLYVADAKKHQVFCYSTVDGAAVRTNRPPRQRAGEFNFPTNVSVDKEGRLYVTDTLNFRIQSFDSDGRPLHAFGTLGDTPGSLNRPKGNRR